MVVILLLTVSTNANNGCDCEYQQQQNQTQHDAPNNRGYTTTTEQRRPLAHNTSNKYGFQQQTPQPPPQPQTAPSKQQQHHHKQPHLSNNEIHLCPPPPPPSQKNNKIYENTCAADCNKSYSSHVYYNEFDQLQTSPSSSLLPKTPAYAVKQQKTTQQNEHNAAEFRHKALAENVFEDSTKVLKYTNANLIPKPPRGNYYQHINNNKQKQQQQHIQNSVKSNDSYDQFNLIRNSSKNNGKAYSTTKDYNNKKHTQQQQQESEQPQYQQQQQCTANCQNRYCQCRVAREGGAAIAAHDYSCTCLRDNNTAATTTATAAAPNCQCYNCNNNNNNTNEYTRYITRVNFYEINTSQVDSLSKDGEDNSSISSKEANTKEEEWITKKKTELVTTKQIETRVQRDLLFEDGKVIEDSGARVSTNTTEDTDKKESQTTEKRNLGLPDSNGNIPAIEQAAQLPPTSLELSSYSKNFKPIVANSLLRELQAKRILSHEVTDDVLETEVVKHFGDVVDEDYVQAVNSGVDNLESHLVALAAHKEIVPAEPKILQNTSKTKKTIDSEDISKRWLGQLDGKIITEERKTTEHEIIDDRDLPIEDDQSTGSREHVNTVQATQRFFKQRDENHVDLLVDGQVVGTEMRYAAENVQLEKDGSLERLGDWDSLSERVRRQRRAQQKTLLQQQKDRKDALTKRPLDFDLEEETRKGETMKWLESHFGSESNGSVDSHFNDTTVEPTKKTYFNVTIKSNHAQMSPIPEQIHAEHRKPPMQPPVAPAADTYVSRDDIIQQKRKSLSLQFLSDAERVHANTYVREPTQKYLPKPSEIAAQHQYHTQSPLIEERLPLDVGNKQSHYVSQRSLQNLSEKRSTSDTKSFYHSNSHLASPAQHNVSTLERPAVPQRRRHIARTQSHQLNGLSQSKLVEHTEPPPDYSPPARHERAASFEDASPTSIISIKQPMSQHTLQRKQQQNTRFATNIKQHAPPTPTPPPQHRYNMTTQTSTPPPQVTHRKSNRVSQAIGNSIRKLVHKIRSASAERKLRKKSRSKSRDRSPVSNKDKANSDAPTTTTYQQYNVIDSHIDGPFNYENGKRRESEKTVLRASDKYQTKIEPAAVLDKSSDEHVQSPRQRYYLGEDPYTSTLRRKSQESGKYIEQQQPRSYREREYTNGNGYIRQSRPPPPTTAYTLGRHPKHSYVTGSMPQLNNDYQTSQTLPRKLQQRHQSEQPQQYTRNRTSITFADKKYPASVVHQEYLPAPSKPMRMPQPSKSLIRSKSLNFNGLNEQEHDSSYYDSGPRASYERQPYKSTINLYKVPKENTLADSTLKSPSIVNLISRSQKDLSRIGVETDPMPMHTTNTINRYGTKSSNAQRQYRATTHAANGNGNGNKVQYLQRTQSNLVSSHPSSTLDFVKDQASIVRRESAHDEQNQPIAGQYHYYHRSAKPIEMPYTNKPPVLQDARRAPIVGELRKLYNNRK